MIHPLAIVHPTASIGQNVKIGPFCLIGSDVLLGDNVDLKSHVIIEGKTTIGNNTVIYPFASIGHAPQDLKYQGESSEIIIGQNNIIREYVTIQPGTTGGGMITMIGDHGLFMVGVHIAHDCKIGSNVILANYVSLAGHVQVYDYAIIGGLSAVLQYVRIGQHAMIGGMSAIDKDIIPFGLAKNERAVLEGLNLVGMKRRGFDKQETLDSVKAIEELFADHGIFADRVNQISQSYKGNVIVEQIINFIQQDNMRAFCQPRSTR
ncbi:Acyl-ACP--UDP-N-acetylglucosamine O-acyltransferase [Candidatus Trichorickettsia mobilis]|uniref:Acyl-[acyl-carrier-protein]--UDP-N-acetylglucosamine O-acyltransferase n=1 Tax=Candidatus Trichorickettsia mobilis TaxID=1346319 RepID=A0ABZ0USM7_9RICK|nr:acyl-ACP--UDP-N-acetylglucosamine O-acyltransferase [Candidatus Trichorickettsia mobilis]WPY01038.1 Acyl-ACP--UDP-N-acetylglucosamine O-acyltransferase [Candidatus Trichorickettsia mobilis]